jgi:hypothetical protein
LKNAGKTWVRRVKMRVPQPCGKKRYFGKGVSDMKAMILVKDDRS